MFDSTDRPATVAGGLLLSLRASGVPSLVPKQLQALMCDSSA
jgi:hypothetical protein